MTIYYILLMLRFPTGGLAALLAHVAVDAEDRRPHVRPGALLDPLRLRRTGSARGSGRILLCRILLFGV